MTNGPDPNTPPIPEHAPAQPAPRRQCRVTPLRVIWGIAALAALGATVALLLTAAPTAQDATRPTGGDSGQALATAGTGPTGVRIHNTDPLHVGDCAEIVPLTRDDVELYRATCDRATFVLDSVQLQCPDRGKAITRDSAQRWCFRWLVRVGDCLDTARNVKVPCTTALDPASAPRTYLKILTVVVGAFDGAQCPDPNLYLRTGRDDHRGIACYENVEPHVQPTQRLLRNPLCRDEGRVTTVHTRTSRTVPDQAAAPSNVDSGTRYGPPAPWLARNRAAHVTSRRAAQEDASSMTPASQRCSTEPPLPADTCQREPHRAPQHAERGAAADHRCGPDRGRRTTQPQPHQRTPHGQVTA